MSKYFVIIFGILFFKINISSVKANDWKYYYDKCVKNQSNIHIGLQDDKFTEDSSIYYINKAIEYSKSEFGELDSNYVLSLSALAVIKTRLKQFDEAKEIFKDILKIDKLIYNANNDIIIRDLDNLGVAFFNLNIFDSTEYYWKQSLAIREQIFAKNHPQIAIGINNIAYIYRFKGKLTEAAELYKEVIRIRRINVKGDHFTLAAPLNSLAIVLSEEGYFDEAEKYYQEAIGIARRLNNYQDGILASYLNNLGNLYQKQNRYLDAEIALKESFEIKNRYLSDNLWQKANSLNDLANLYFQLGSYSQAENMFRKALELRQADTPGDNSNVAKTLENLAELYIQIGQYSKAEPILNEALKMRQRLFNNEHQSIASNLYKLGILYRIKKNYDKAELFLKNALEMYLKLFKAKQQDYALCLRELAIVYYLSSRPFEANNLLTEAISIQTDIYKIENEEMADTYFEIGNLYKSTNEYLLAEQSYIKAINIMKNVFNKQSKYLSEIEKEKYWNKINIYFDKFNEFAINRSKSQISYNTLANNLLFSKKLILNSNIKIRNTIFNSGNYELIKKYEKWLFINEQIANEYKEQSVNELLIDSLNNQLNELEKKLSLFSSEFDNGKLEGFEDIQDIKKYLNEFEFAVDIFKNNNEKGEAAYFALILAVNKPTILIEIGEENDIEQQYYNYINCIKNEVYDYNSYNIFWEKIAKAIPNARKIYLAPDGIYNIINISSLINPKTEKYILEEQDIRLVSSYKSVVPSSKPINENREIVLIGNPKFDIDDLFEPDTNDKKKIKFGKFKLDSNLISKIERNLFHELPFAETEITNINDIVIQKNPDSKISIYLKEEATEEVIKSINKPYILHIATHGQYFSQSNSDSNNYLFKISSYNPLNNSMLFFAGAESILKNNKLHNNKEDGILTAYEARNINLNGTELTVISSCESGLGLIKVGEGAYSMQRAFLEAGSNWVITTLWTINDQAAQEFMNIFYKNLYDVNSIEKAFNKAQIYIKSKYDHPYYWAAYTLISR